MKKFTSIFLGFFYLLLSVGVNVNFHYCLGKLDTIEIFITDIHRCCEYEAKSRSCCQDDRFFFQLDEDHQMAQAGALPQPLSTDTPVDLPPVPLKNFVPASALHTNTPEEHAPPPWPSKAWIFFCSPVYYG